MRRLGLLAAGLMMTSLPVPAAAGEPAPKQLTGVRTSTITLVTGDQVLLQGTSISPVPAKGREQMIFHIYEAQGHRYVVQRMPRKQWQRAGNKVEQTVIHAYRLKR